MIGSGRFETIVGCATLSLVALAALGGVAWAKSDIEGLRGEIILTGTCTKFIVLGKDRSATCMGKFISNDFKDGRTDLYFATDQGTVVAFSTRVNAQVRPDDDTVVQPVDIIYLHVKQDTTPMKAVGFCRYTNPYKGPSPIECEAYTASGTFGAAFISDGSAPTEKKF